MSDTESKNIKLLDLCKGSGTYDEIEKVLKSGAEACAQNEETGASALMYAAGRGSGEIVSLLLQYGAPWNAIDRKGRCAGEYALENSHQKVVDQLVDAGVTAEMILARLEDNKKTGMSTRPPSNMDYLQRDVSYLQDGDTIVDTNRDAVMMEWERPLMEIHADVLCSTKGHVLNIGFGMGIVDGAIQRRNPASHTIIEAHPQIYAKMIKDGWNKKKNVNVVFGRWQDVIDKLGPFDAIFFDTYGEYMVCFTSSSRLSNDSLTHSLTHTHSSRLICVSFTFVFRNF